MDKLLTLLRTVGATHYYRNGRVAFGYRAPLGACQMCELRNDAPNGGSAWRLIRDWVAREGDIPALAEAVNHV